jgi:uncharacterized protein (DUF302 family)
MVIIGASPAGGLSGWGLPAAFRLIVGRRGVKMNDTGWIAGIAKGTAGTPEAGGRTMTDSCGYGYTKSLGDTDFDSALERVTAALKEEGFGVLTEIDVKKTLKAKIDVDFRRYMILGACNPVLAHQAITAVPDIGLLLPCNVLVRQEEDGRVRVDFMDPLAVLGLVDDARVEPLAGQVRAKLEKVLEVI